MTFWDKDGQEHYFIDYDQFRSFCKENVDIQDMLRNIVHIESKENKDPKKWEILQILKAIERGFQIQLPNKDKQIKGLLFPIESYESVGAITALPPLTMFQ